MAVKIRLKRIGAKKNPFYRIVVADARYPRDGRFIEQIGTYDPMTNPAKVSIDGIKALQWIKNGAQPTDTVRALIKNAGALEKAKEELEKRQFEAAENAEKKVAAPVAAESSADESSEDVSSAAESSEDVSSADISSADVSSADEAAIDENAAASADESAADVDEEDSPADDSPEGGTDEGGDAETGAEGGEPAENEETPEGGGDI